MWIYFCSCCSVTAVKNKQCYWFSWNASCRASIKARLFYQFTYFEQRVYFLCNPPWGTPVAEQNHCRNVCFLLCQCNFCSFPSVFGPASESSLHVLLLNVREICFTKKTWIWVFKGFLALDKNGWFALRSAHCGSELKQRGWNKRWFFYVHTRTGSYCVLLSCRSALLHLSHLFLSPLAVREPW